MLFRLKVRDSPVELSPHRQSILQKSKSRIPTPTRYTSPSRPASTIASNSSKRKELVTDKPFLGSLVPYILRPDRPPGLQSNPYRIKFRAEYEGMMREVSQARFIL